MIIIIIIYDYSLCSNYTLMGREVNVVVRRIASGTWSDNWDEPTKWLNFKFDYVKF